MKKICSFVLFLWIVLVYAQAYGINTDADGNILGSTQTNSRKSAIVEPTTFPESTTTILMDYSHGVLFDNYPESTCTNLIALLEAQGHTVVASDEGILNLNLSDYGVIILNAIWSATGPYSSQEVSAVQNFVNTGGGLFLIGEAAGCGGCAEANSNLSQVSYSLAGIMLGASTISPTDLYFTNFQSHEIFDGISQLYFRYAGGLEVVQPGTELAYTDSVSDVTVAGYGKIIAVGDGSFIDDGSYWGIADDQLFLENIFNFLSGGVSSPPSVTTTSPSSVTTTTATCGGNVASNGGATVTARGVCWSTSTGPDTSDNKTSNGTGLGSFTSTLSNLTPGTEYYVRAYATNSQGTGYGSEMSFTTTSSGSLPTVTTAPVTSITSSSAVSGGTVSLDGTSSEMEIPDAESKLYRSDLIYESFKNAKETTRVIVNLRRPLSAMNFTDLSSNEIRTRLAQAVSQTQQSVIAQLNPLEVRLTNRFSYLFAFSAEVTEKGLQQLIDNPEVESIEPDAILHLNLKQGIPLMKASSPRSTYSDAGLSVAICDTGIDYTHSKLGSGGFPNSKIIGGYDCGDDDSDPMDYQGHGTACAGIVAGSSGTVGDYIGGVAYNAKLYAVKISTGTTGSASTSNMIEGWEWCITHQNDDSENPIMVISTSFGGSRFTSTCDSASSAMTEAAANAVSAGITVFASSGNDGYCDGMGWPACITHVISVGAVYDANFGQNPPSGYVGCIADESCTGTPGPPCDEKYYVDHTTSADIVATYSNTASFLDLFAPSNWATTTKKGGGYWNTANGFGGTSAACPYAAGAAVVLQNASKNITGAYLTPDQVKAKLINYGDFVTDGKVSITKPRINLEASVASLGSASKPTVSTTAPYSVTSSSAKSGGNVTSDGGAAVSQKGVCWSTSENPTTSHNKTDDGSGTGSFTSTISNLSSNTTYHVRAYAINSVGTAYGSDMTFTTSSDTDPVTARGVCWSTSANPDVNDSKTNDGSGVGSFTSEISGLATGTTYYVRAYATNSVGTGYGSEKTFSTLVSTSKYYVSKTGYCGDKTPCYATIQTALNAASDGGHICVASGTYEEAPRLNQSKSITLSGRWNTNFDAQGSSPTFIKAPTVPQGSLTLQEVIVKP